MRYIKLMYYLAWLIFGGGFAFHSFVEGSIGWAIAFSLGCIFVIFYLSLVIKKEFLDQSESQ